MTNRTYRTNVRAIDNEELLQIISESNGIYESTLVKLLQCNKITLHSKLKTMLDNQLISRNKLGKHFFYTNNYNVKNFKDLELQTNAVQCISKMLFNISDIKVTTNKRNEKQLFTTFYTFPKNLMIEKTDFKYTFQSYYNSIEYDALKDFFYELSFSFISKFKIKFSSIDEYSILNYTNDDFETIEVLAINTRGQLGEVKARLDSYIYFDEFIEKQKFIRDTILIYIEDEDVLLRFEVDELNLGTYGYKEVEIVNAIDLLYLVSLTWYTHVFTSNCIKDKDSLNHLYEKSFLNKQKFNTLSLR
ncbi:hypothetical protein [Vagococcus fluvialis]|uniref:hypothetical protein n=1 Tax=Vagococcus fluvialis TaxID=2738 RepID=UPI003B5A84DB